MKILMVIKRDSVRNPYVSSLVGGLIKTGNEVICSLDLFWDHFEDFDVLYFQWPESIFQWRITDIDIEKLSNHFDRIDKSKVKTVAIVHNLHPHNNDAKTNDLYSFLYSRVDAFHHLGRYSYSIFKEKYPQKYHFVVPHHVADILWDETVSKPEARCCLRVPNNRVVISSFGAFRSEGEVRLFVNMTKDVAGEDVSFWAPRIRLGRLNNGWNLFKTIKYIQKSLFFRIKGIKYSGFLSNNELKLWLSASDIVFIQRNEILNSGNIALAFSAGKVVVGPNVGNVGAILQETGNFVFDPFDRASVKEATLNAIENVRSNNRLGIMNYNYAKDNWSTYRICKLINRELAIIKNMY